MKFNGLALLFALPGEGQNLFDKILSPVCGLNDMLKLSAPLGST